MLEVLFSLILLNLLVGAIIISFFPTSGFLIALTLFLLSLALYFVYFIRKGLVLLDEMTVGVVFNQRNNNFAYFIDSNVTDESFKFINKYRLSRINKMIHKGGSKYHHFLDPFNERLEDKITRGSYKGDDKTEDLRTREGIPVEIKWRVSFRLDVTKIKPGIEHKMARALPQHAGNMIGGKALHTLRHIVEQMSITELYQEDARKNLEERLRQGLLPKVEIFGVIGIHPNNQVQIESIEMPPQIEKALQAAHQRKLQTDTVTSALKSLKEAISDFEDKDMGRLSELERLRIVDENSASLVYFMDSFVKNNAVKNVYHHHNGKQNSNGDHDATVK